MVMAILTVTGILMLVRGQERQLQARGNGGAVGVTRMRPHDSRTEATPLRQWRLDTPHSAAAVFASRRSRGDKSARGAQAYKKPEPHLQYRANLSPQNHPHDYFITV